MRDNGVPMTRENYINFAFGGTPPDEIGPELEADFPEQFRQKAFIPPKR